MICINNLSKISILTKYSSKLSNPHKSMKSLFLKSLFSKKLSPKVGGLRLKNFWLKFFQSRILSDTASGFNNL